MHFVNRYKKALGWIAIILILAVGSLFFLRPERIESDSLADVQPIDEVQLVDKVQIEQETFKILHIMSYHQEWEWNIEQLDGFKYPLRDLDIEYKIFEMDTKRQSTEEWKTEVGAEARGLIETWQPDLVYLNDDDAQRYVTQHFVNTDIPFVFSGVNAEPEAYDFVGSSNVTGVLERPHYAQSVQLLKRIAPDIKTIAVVIDDSAMWDNVIGVMKAEADQLPDVNVVHWDAIFTFDEYKQKIAEYQTEVDAIALIGIFNFKDEDGVNVPFEDVLQWTTENSDLPDFSFWDSRIPYGTLGSVTVSGYEQGLAAGKIARGILVDGKSPNSFPMEQTQKGKPWVSLARANRLGLAVESEILLTAQIIQDFKWDE